MLKNSDESMLSKVFSGKRQIFNRLLRWLLINATHTDRFPLFLQGSWSFCQTALFLGMCQRKHAESDRLCHVFANNQNATLGTNRAREVSTMNQSKIKTFRMRFHSFRCGNFSNGFTAENSFKQP